MTGPDDRDAEERAWRDIVEHYGERVELGSVPEGEERPSPPREEFLDTGLDTEPDEPTSLAWLDEDRFVPPTPPPLPRPTPRRAVAWAGVFGAPLLLLVSIVLPVDLPAVLDLALVGAFVGGFGYLVGTMPRGPRDPWDDGSRI